MNQLDKNQLDPKKRRNPRPVRYPIPEDFEPDEDHEPKEELKMTIVQIPYDHDLSLAAKLILNSFQKKYIYHAIDDILYMLDRTSNERADLLSLLHSTMIALQNIHLVDFFKIWIDELYISKNLKPNRFLNTKYSYSYHITLRILYTTKKPPSKIEPLW